VHRLVFAVAASGGGHTGYAAAVASELLRRGHLVVFLVDPGDRWSAERLRRLHPGAPMLPLPRLRGPGEPLLRALLRRSAVAQAGVLRAARLLRRLGVDAVLCTGSNQSLLAALAALAAGVPVACVEAVDRVATRSRTPALLHDLLGVPVLLHWPLQRRLYPRRGVVVGPIVAPPPSPPPPPPRDGYVLALTGSVGNPRLVKLLLRTRLERVVVQTGRLTPPELVERARPGWRAVRFTPEPWRLVLGARVVLSHQGLGLVEAALSYRRPVVLAFNPDLHMTSGRRDAEMLARLLGAPLVDPSRATPEDLEEAVERAAERTPPRYPLGAPAAAALLERLARAGPG
jgi:UDP-N-acetylglucosamine--N-acetylmuramyl-(pentapeptide) pyrophosphoryl-undecaprenol N-acetylglucosamine transferase